MTACDRLGVHPIELSHQLLAPDFLARLPHVPEGPYSMDHSKVVAVAVAAQLLNNYPCLRRYKNMVEGLDSSSEEHWLALSIVARISLLVSRSVALLIFRRVALLISKRPGHIVI